MVVECAGAFPSFDAIRSKLCSAVSSIVWDVTKRVVPSLQLDLRSCFFVFGVSNFLSRVCVKIQPFLRCGLVKESWVYITHVLW